MAGHDHREVVRGACRRHGAHGPGSPDSVGDVGVARGLPGGDLPQRLPYLALELRPAHVERGVDTVLRRFHEADHLSGAFIQLCVAVGQHGVRKAALEIPAQRVTVVAEQDGDHALRALRNQHEAERGFADRHLHLLALGVFGKRAGRAGFWMNSHDFLLWFSLSLNLLARRNLGASDWIFSPFSDR